MKIERIHIERFKRFNELTIEFKNRAVDQIADQYLLLGDNGSGKTTLLQAIALVLSLVSSKCRSFEDFHWLGWVPGRFMRWGIPRVEIVVHFSTEENETTRELARPYYDRFVDKARNYVEPPNHSVVHVVLEGARYWTEPPDARYQFYGRRYAAALVGAGESRAYKSFDQLPGIFWFDQFRNLAGTRLGDLAGARHSEASGREIRQSSANGLSPELAEDADDRAMASYLFGVGRLRQFLNSWKLAKLSKAPIKYIDELEQLYQRVFPDRSFDYGEIEFRGVSPTPENMFFLLRDDVSGKTYDVEEMSSGEQAVFPILYEFVRNRIRNSVVLIDEIDLNLHPPHSQALLNLLPQLGPDCQFFYTTHSRSISSVVSPYQVYRLPGGRPCL
jgi:energy-coupling factor transporter ATP-binding protein EcfA2